MYISILTDGEIEDELGFEICCFICCRDQFNWSFKQFNIVRQMIDSNEPFIVPLEITKKDFPAHIKNNIGVKNEIQ